MIEPSELTDADRAYMAALVDHKGKIFVDRRTQPGGRKRYVLTLQFKGLSKETYSWAKSHFSGASVGLNGLRFVTFRASVVLVQCFSFLKSASKAAQAKLAFKLNEMRPSQGRMWTDAELELRSRLSDQIAKAAKPTPRVSGVKAALPCFEVAKLTGGG